MADDANNAPTVFSQTSRRRLLQAGASTAALGLAGCFGDGGNGNGGNGDGGNGNGGNGDGGNGNGGNGNGGNGNSGNGNGGNNGSRTFIAPINSSPGEVHYNPYNTGQYVGGLSQLIWDSLFQYNFQTGEWHNRIGTDLEVDGTTATLTLSPDHSWMDGDPVVAEDVITQLELERHIDYPIWNYIDDVEALDDTTIELTLQEEMNPDVFIDILNREIHVKRDGEFVDWIEQFENAGSDEERDQVQEDFLQFRYAEDNDDPMANGPYTIDAEQEGQWVLSRHENYPIETNIDTYEKLSVGGDEDIWQLMTSDRIDGRVTQAVESGVAEQFPDHLHRIEIPANEGLAPMFNFQHEVFGTREFRQAMMFLIDRNVIEQNVNPRHVAVGQISGLNDGIAQDWLGEDFIQNSLTTYGVESKPDRAEEKMQEGGFEKQGGQWRDTNGDPITVEWYSPPWPGPIGISQTLEQTLPDFGIDVSSTTVQPGQFFTARGNGDFQFAFNALAGGPHPYFFAQDVLEAPKTSHSGHPTDEVELPPIGEPDGSSEMVNLNEMIQGMASNEPREEILNHVEQYAWWFNQELPYLKLTDATFPSYISSDGWNIPDPDDDVMYVHGPAVQLFKESEENSDQALIQSDE